MSPLEPPRIVVTPADVEERSHSAAGMLASVEERLALPGISAEEREGLQLRRTALRYYVLYLQTMVRYPRLMRRL